MSHRLMEVYSHALIPVKDSVHVLNWDMCHAGYVFITSVLGTRILSESGVWGIFV